MADDSIERLKKKLYSREASEETPPREGLTERFTASREGWEHTEELPTMPVTSKKQRSLLGIFFTAAVAFFILSILISAFFIFRGNNVVSAKNVSIDIQGPATVEGGEETVLEVSIVNENAIPITLVDLIVEFPEGTRSVTNLNQELIRHRESLGTIESGQSVERSIRALLFGEEGSEKSMKVSLEYRIADSNAIFYKEAPYTVILSSAPLQVTVDTLAEAVSGQELTVVVDVSSNSKAPLKDVLLVADYPFGFSFVSAQPKASFDTTVWELGDLAPGARKRITLKGTLSGQEGEERVFRFASGVQSSKNDREIAAQFGAAQETVTVKRPFLSTTVALNGSESPEYVSKSGRMIRADIAWTNNLPTQIYDTEIEVKLNGAALNKSSVSVDRGFYRSSDNTIVWNQSTDNRLSEVAPGETGRASFSFSSFDLSSTALKNQKIEFSVSVRGKRVANQVPESLTSVVTRSVKLSTDLDLVSKIVRNSGPFANSGPIPPKAELETTYTVVLSVSNSSNNIAGARVVTSLPTYVRWVGQVSPQGEDITFNPVGGVVTWNIGAIPAGIGHQSSPREVAFQIGLNPSISQVGSAPILLNEQVISGYDAFTDIDVSSTRPSLTTKLSEGGLPNNHAGVTQ